MKKRLDFIDIAKGIGIILVYVGHTCTLNSNMFQWIYSFHMPLFFAISGYMYAYSDKVLNNIDGGGYFKRKIINLLIPFVLFSIINALTLFIIQEDFSLIKILFHGWGTNPLWFIPVLFAIEIIFYTLHKCEKKLPRILTSCFVIVTFIIKITTNKYGPWSFTEIPWFLICYISGYCAYPFLVDFKPYKMHTNLIALCISLFLFLCHYVFLYEVILPYNVNFRQQDNDFVSYIMRYGIACIGVIMIYFFSKGVSKIRLSHLLTYCGKNSLVILCTHMLVFQCFHFFMVPSSVTKYFSWMVIIPLIWIYNRYFVLLQLRLKKI